MGTDADHALVLCGADQIVLAKLEAEQAGDLFGRDLCSVGDVNADGVPDVLIGGPGGGPSSEGVVALYSGADWQPLLVLYGEQQDEAFGSAVAGPGDVNLDGIPDLLVGAYLASPAGVDSGRALVLSGSDGQVLHAHGGGDAGEMLGRSVSFLGDLDVDGYPEYLIGSSGYQGVGCARIHQGQDGSKLHEFVGAEQDRAFGIFTAGGGDLDGDGTPDLLVGDTKSIQFGQQAGLARAYSGATLELLLTVPGEKAGDLCGRVEMAGDVDGDVREDFLVGSIFADPGGADSGSVRLLSGRDGLVLARYDGTEFKGHQGIVAGVGDLDSDGIPDLAVAGRDEDAGGKDSGTLRVWRGERLHFWADRETLSLSKGGEQRLQLRLGADRAGAFYLVLGCSGDGLPGLVFPDDDVFLPLNPDEYFVFTLTNPNQGPLNDSLGYLDETGFAEATVSIPPDSNPAYVGVQVRHAYILMENGWLYFASEALRLSLEP